MMKKFLSALLILAVLLSLVPYAFAEEGQEAPAEEAALTEVLLRGLNEAPLNSNIPAHTESLGGGGAAELQFTSKNSILPYETMNGLCVSLSDLASASVLDFAIKNENPNKNELYIIEIFKGDVYSEEVIGIRTDKSSDYPKGIMYLGLELDWSLCEPGEYTAYSFVARNSILGTEIDEDTISVFSIEVTEEVRPMTDFYLLDYETFRSVNANSTITLAPGETKEFQITASPFYTTGSRALSTSMCNPSMINCGISDYGGYITLKMGTESAGLVCFTVTLGNISKHFFVNTPSAEEGSLTAEYIKRPTCTEAGEASRLYCPICETQISGHTVVPATGHSFTSKVINNSCKKSDATCTMPATYYYSCSECGETGTKTFTFGSPKGHSFSSAWSYDESCHWHAATCEHTSVQGSKAEHSWDSGVVIIPAETGKEGSKTCTCTVCGAKKDFVIPAIVSDPKTEFVDRMFQVCFGRQAEQSELDYRLWQIKNGETGVKIASDFIFSDELKMKKYCDRHYVIALYNAFMGREPKENEIESWMYRLQQGDRREDVFNEFAVSDEFGNICKAAGIVQGDKIEFSGTGTRPGGYCSVADCTASKSIVAFAKRLYNVCLDREPKQEEINAWHYYLVHGEHTATSAAKFFLFGEEFTSRNYDNTEFVKHLYRAMMGREPDAGGLEYWVWLLENGTSREDAFNQFAQEDEFKKICQEYNVVHG